MCVPIAVILKYLLLLPILKANNETEIVISQGYAPPEASGEVLAAS
jgi:hypothetical protein